MKIAVTGGLGYIGSRLIKSLLSYGHEVMILDNLSTPVESHIAGVKINQCDITDPECLKGIKAPGFNILLHLAAQSSGAYSFEHPDEDIRINVLGTLNMINWCRDNDIPRIVFASSFTVYGDHPESEILSEDLSCQPKAIYALSKLTCENLLRIYAEPHGISWNALRMFNVYGPGQDLSRRDQGMVSIFMGIVREQSHVGVQGSLKRFRDFIFIDDVIQGWEKCISNDNPDYYNKVYNLGSGSKMHVGTMINILIEAFGKSGQVSVGEAGSTPGDIRGCYADISAIKQDLGYQPKYSFHLGIKLMVDWANSLDKVA